MSFGLRLKQSRKRLKLSGSELAAKLGVERSTIPQYETGRSFPSVPVLQKMARVLGITLDWLLFDEYEARDEIQDKELLTYFTKVDRLDPRERAAIKIFLENMLARQELDEFKLAARNKTNAA